MHYGPSNQTDTSIFWVWARRTNAARPTLAVVSGTHRFQVSCAHLPMPARPGATYLSDYIQSVAVSNRRRLKPSSSSQLVIRRTRLSTVGIHVRVFTKFRPTRTFVSSFWELRRHTPTGALPLGPRRRPPDQLLLVPFMVTSAACFRDILKEYKRYLSPSCTNNWKMTNETRKAQNE